MQNKKINLSELQLESLTTLKDLICPWLDAERGYTINDNKIFARFAKKWEHSFLSDMAKLNVLPCDVLTRVSEYIPEIIKFIEVLIKKKFAYVLNNSVYFDIEQFNKTPGFKYAKLEPSAFNDYNLVSEAEGEFQTKLDQKKSPGDFALWKKSKMGEPRWESPWGEGRPGWHIECSVMASDITGKVLDIHSGGIDLTFPHHDNELAQSEAYHDVSNWVKYFLHTGHLNIKGLKMSKSLKNFITIEEILTISSAKQIRIMFLLSHWSQTFDYTPERLNEASHYETLINNFISKIDALSLLTKSNVTNNVTDNVTESNVTESNATESNATKFKSDELNLFKELNTYKKRIHLALCDSFNTPEVMSIIREIIEKSNKYIFLHERNHIKPNSDILKIVSTYVKSILSLLGIPETNINEFNSENKSQENFIEAVNEFSKFRSKIRDLIKEKATTKEIFKECDRVRDDIFPKLGVQLDDFESGNALVKFVGKSAAATSKKKNTTKNLSKNGAKKINVSLSELFKTGQYLNMFSEYDDKGIPTKDQNGQCISKSLRKKLEKRYNRQASRTDVQKDSVQADSVRGNQ